MSTYSSSSQDDAVYSSPGLKQYRLVTPGMLNDPRSMSQVSPGFIFVIFLSLRLLSAVFFSICSHVIDDFPSIFLPVIPDSRIRFYMQG